jgi:hypothetical protein
MAQQHEIRAMRGAKRERFVWPRERMRAAIAQRSGQARQRGGAWLVRTNDRDLHAASFVVVYPSAGDAAAEIGATMA